MIKTRLVLVSGNEGVLIGELCPKAPSTLENKNKRDTALSVPQNNNLCANTTLIKKPTTAHPRPTPPTQTHLRLNTPKDTGIQGPQRPKGRPIDYVHAPPSDGRMLANLWPWNQSLPTSRFYPKTPYPKLLPGSPAPVIPGTPENATKTRRRKTPHTTKATLSSPARAK